MSKFIGVQNCLATVHISYKEFTLHSKSFFLKLNLQSNILPSTIGVFFQRKEANGENELEIPPPQSKIPLDSILFRNKTLSNT